MLSRRKLLLYKVESVKGADVVPTVLDDLIIIANDANISVATDKDRGEGELKGTFGPGHGTVLKQTVSLEAQTRVRGLGQGAGALLLPDIHPFLLASGHTVTTAGDGSATPRSAVYKPTSVETSFKSGTGYWYEDGLLWKLLGAQNPISFEASMNALMMKATVQAPYTEPTVQAMPAITYPATEFFKMTKALAVITEGGATVNIGSFTFDAGVSIEERNETGYHYYEITNRDPTISIDPRAVPTAADWQALTNATKIAIVATFTNILGETLVFNAPLCEADEVTPGARAGRITRQKTFSIKEGAAGDDQYTITWTATL